MTASPRSSPPMSPAYNRLIDQDEAGTLAAPRRRRSAVLEPAVARHHGLVVEVTGDGVLVEFGSAVNAVACAVDLQSGMFRLRT